MACEHRWIAPAQVRLSPGLGIFVTQLRARSTYQYARVSGFR